ncbi:MAG: hypothetical protein ACOWWM_01825 [Desulfobacterales bacterium]
MLRLAKILIHLGIFAAGVASLAHTYLWDWNLFRGLLLPMANAAFFFYLIGFLLTGAYRIFLPDRESKAH